MITIKINGCWRLVKYLDYGQSFAIISDQVISSPCWHIFHLLNIVPYRLMWHWWGKYTILSIMSISNKCRLCTFQQLGFHFIPSQYMGETDTILYTLVSGNICFHLIKYLQPDWPVCSHMISIYKLTGIWGIFVSIKHQNLINLMEWPVNMQRGVQNN